MAPGPVRRTSSTLPPSGKSRRVQAGRHGQVELVQRVVHQAGQVRVADADPQAVPDHAADHGPSRAEDGGRAHVHADLAVRFHADLADPGPGRHRERRPGGQAVLQQVAGEHADAVAAHLGDAAVGVAVVHEPLRRAGFRGASGRGTGFPRSRWPGAGQRGGTDHPQHAVRPDPGPAVAQPRGGGRREVMLAAGVGQDHEVVLGAVALGELALAKFVLGELALGEWLLGGRHLSMVASAWPAGPRRDRRPARPPGVAAEPGLLAAGEPAGRLDGLLAGLVLAPLPGQQRSTCACRRLALPPLSRSSCSSPPSLSPPSPPPPPRFPLASHRPSPSRPPASPAARHPHRTCHWRGAVFVAEKERLLLPQPRPRRYHRIASRPSPARAPAC